MATERWSVEDLKQWSPDLNTIAQPSERPVLYEELHSGHFVFLLGQIQWLAFSLKLVTHWLVCEPSKIFALNWKCQTFQKKQAF